MRPHILSRTEVIGRQTSSLWKTYSRPRAFPVWTRVLSAPCPRFTNLRALDDILCRRFTRVQNGDGKYEGGEGQAVSKAASVVPPALEHKSAKDLKRTNEESLTGLQNDNRLLTFWGSFNCKSTKPNQLFKSYLQLPVPRLQYLSQEQVYGLLSRISIIKKGDENTMLQYLTIIDDMKTGRVPIPRYHWNTAISFVAKCYRHLTDHDLQSGLFLWKEMERSAGVLADATTFNILFHLATNSNMAHLPLMILKEMKRRNIPMDRFSYVNLIMYYGKQGDGRGIRHAYREFIRTGEVVDIVVLNAVMTALIDAGEPQAAEDVLMHLIQLPTKLKSEPSSEDQSARKLHKDIRNLRWILAQQGFDPRMDLRLAPLAPDLVSFAIFIDYHARETADFGKILSLLNDLAECGINPEASTLQSLFKGFALHGSVRYTPWTLQRLNAVFDAFMNRGYCISQDATLWCLRAHVILAGKKRGREVWEIVKMRWIEQGGNESEISEVEHRLSRMKKNL
ncbi:hypothetical protein TWF106_001561 [Orbilia oligospora]|uniref:Pentatricopeptide repeat-containing protein n=1 Tax=Orbilia oligospora TaxID=2813651 RepID=A0A6G1M1C5_ORBOL|nr:hypothetical protein TWF788_010176 [Orbilia oligospora]KAF3201456.1 hypothetical protein TWF679_011344 [Orbilia oligospora]KAF3204382.1 hypothetical protein TWF106_001561 [Orbilia oligospora]KAF3214317.1 hypothetical protein TWF191_009830 [Orbilia oligospora]KAF3241461.1 hypothetical protein TWF192_009198 [Orbilia oligospora]